MGKRGPSRLRGSDSHVSGRVGSSHFDSFRRAHLPRPPFSLPPYEVKVTKK